MKVIKLEHKMGWQFHSWILDLHVGHDGFYWFRIFGRGLHMVDRNKNSYIPFSFRIGKKKYLKLGRYWISALKKR